MSLHIGDTAPDFTVDTQNGEISLHDWAGDSWVFFFSHPSALRRWAALRSSPASSTSAM